MKKFISLLSGGFDSPIATYLMIIKKFKPIFLSFLTSDDDNHSMENKVILIAKKLSEFSRSKSNFELYFIDHDPNLNIIKNSCERKLTCILCKRMMINIAKRIAELENTNLIVTGDILGEQASQTIVNLYEYNDLMKDFVFLRPLIGMDKINIIKLSEKVGLYKLCSQKSATCTFYPQYPETKAKKKEVNLAEASLELQELITNSIQNSRKMII